MECDDPLILKVLTEGGDGLKQQINLEGIVDLLKKELSESLTGIYLHGSLALGGFNPGQSDIDLLVIVKERHEVDTYKRIASQLLLIEKELEIIKGIELSVVLESYADEFVYPTPFEFHYSAFHREKYKADTSYFCGGFEDPDIAAHFTLIYDRGVVLYGKPIRDVFKPIDKQYFIHSIMSDIEGSLEGIADNPEYYVLNLSRTLCYMKESVISSKREGGEWALNVVPDQYADVINQCLAKYNGEMEYIELNNQILFDFAHYMLDEIASSRQIK